MVCAEGMAAVAQADQMDIHGPPVSVSFGRIVKVLPGGNIVIADPDASAGRGAVYLYTAAGQMISALTGTGAGDAVGGGGITVLGNGNFVVGSPAWQGWRGAATWINGQTGLTGQISAANSLVGGAAFDAVGERITALGGNGNYVVISSSWQNAATQASDAGAVTWGSGWQGIQGSVSELNSFVGTTAEDFVGTLGVAVLTNGNYVIRSDNWNNAAVGAPGAGAATWGEGASGSRHGVVAPSNSWVGTSAGDDVSGGGVVALSNGNYVVASPQWANGSAVEAGAVTWGDGGVGSAGAVSAQNSLVGTTAHDKVGTGLAIAALANGNYAVGSPLWDNGGVVDVGAATWASGAGGTVGPIDTQNSLVGSTTKDSVGAKVIALADGNYVVSSPAWDDSGTVDVGAVTWRNGFQASSGAVTKDNSMVGASANDRVGSGGAVALTNNHYVIVSPSWNNGSASLLGAVTWCFGGPGQKGLVTQVYSLAGSHSADLVGWSGVVPLRNGNYVVNSPFWSDGTFIGVGASTWGDGFSGTVGEINSVNSLVGASANDRVGLSAVALPNGDYVVNSSNWTTAGIAQAGAVTWANGSSASGGFPSANNSLVGATFSDVVGVGGIVSLANSAFIVRSQYWDSATNEDVGAISFSRGNGAGLGAISQAISGIGSAAGAGLHMTFDYDVAGNRMVVGRPDSNIVTVFRDDGIFQYPFEPR